MNQPWITWMIIALLGLRLAEISDTVRRHLGEIISPRLILKSVKSVWNRICIIKGKEPSNTIHHLSMSMIEMSRLNVTLLMHWQISFLIILPLLSADMHMFVRKLQGRIYTFHLIILKYTTGPSLLKSCRMLIEPMIVQQDQMKYTISYLNIYLVPLYYFS